MVHCEYQQLGNYKEANNNDGCNEEPLLQGKVLSRFRLVLCIAAFCLAIIISAVTFTILHSSKHESATTVCTKPYIRHEWRTFSREEKRAYILSVKCLKTKPSRLGFQNHSLYDDFPYFHSRVGEQSRSAAPLRVFQLLTMLAHYTAAFFSWHRWFIYLYEEALRAECGYDGYLPLVDLAIREKFSVS